MSFPYDVGMILLLSAIRNSNVGKYEYFVK